MVQIIETIDVDVPVRTAYDQWTQFESFPRFLDEQLGWTPEGLVETLGSFVGAGGHAVRKGLQNFKEFIESPDAPTGAWRGDLDA